MNKTLPLSHYIALLLLSALALIGENTFARDVDATKLAPVLQPFVESHTLAGAVVLVAATTLL